MRINTIMTILCLAVFSLFIIGCGPTESVEVSEPDPVILREAQPEGEEVVVVKPEVSVDEEIVDLDEKSEQEAREKQVETGATDISEESLTLLADVNCTFVDKNPEGFAFTMTNIEEKEWALSAISYDERERFSNPILTVNALQVTNSQLIAACGGKSRIKPGQTVDCVFDLTDVKNTILRKSLRTGETALGNYNANVISLRTPDHAAETTFWC